MSARKVEANLFVILGATGDLMQRKLLPAVFRLSREGALSGGFRVLGVARDRTLDDGSYRRWAAEILKKSGTPADEAVEWCERHLEYEPVEQGGGYERLARRIEVIETRRRMYLEPGETLYVGIALKRRDVLLARNDMRAGQVARALHTPDGRTVIGLRLEGRVQLQQAA